MDDTATETCRLRRRLAGQVLARQPALCFPGGGAGVGKSFLEDGQLFPGHQVGLLAVQCGLDLQVDQEVDVLAQRRGAIGIALQPHAHVQPGPGGQLGPGQQAIDHGAQGQAIGAARQVAHDVAVALAAGGVQLRGFRCMQGQELAALVDTVGAKARVGDEGATGLALGQEAGRATVGSDHALFHQLL